MGVVVEDVESLGTGFTREQQTISPNYVTGTFVIDDNDDHDFKFDGRGKSKLSVFVENPGDQTLTIQVYGMHAIDGVPGDVGVIQIGADWTVTDANDRGYRTVADPFPFYLVRVTSAGAATSSPTCTVYADFHSGG